MSKVKKGTIYRREGSPYSYVRVRMWIDGEIGTAQKEEVLAARAAPGTSGATINRYLTTISRIFSFAVDMRFARQSPTLGVKRAREMPKSLAYLSPEDEMHLHAAMPDRPRTPSRMALDTGLRAGEIGALKPRDIDIRRSAIVVRESKNRQPREVGMTQRLREVMRRQMKAVPRDAPRVFRMPDKKNFARARYRTAFQHATKAADLDGFRFHDLRHCAGVRLAEAGATPAVIKAVLGHKSLAATMRYMDHAPLDAARTAAQLIDSRRASETGSLNLGKGT